MLFARLIFESFSFAGNSLKANRLRTFLSLLGITIGIFAIISVFTVIDSLENYIRSSLNSLGNNMLFIQKWPWTPPEGETEYPWWRYVNRPNPTLAESEEIRNRSGLAENVAFLVGFNATVQYGGSTSDNTEVMASTYSLFDLWNLELERGRYFTEEESRSGYPVALIGRDLVDRLFSGVNPLGKEIKVNGYRMTIIGTYEKKGQDMFGTSMDKRVHICVPFAVQMVDFKDRDMGQTINAEAGPGVDREHFKAELEGIMRSIRRLKPMQENDFALNEISVLSSSLDAFFKVFNLAGSIIGGFSILVGGFGIANIMFVSVKERTRQIGIQKSLGAKRYFILMEFIFESVILSMLGGVAGLIFVFAGTLIVNGFSEMTLLLSFYNIMVGLFISGTIGLLAGFLPALTAARLDPVTAMNSVA